MLFLCGECVFGQIRGVQNWRLNPRIHGAYIRLSEKIGHRFCPCGNLRGFARSTTAAFSNGAPRPRIKRNAVDCVPLIAFTEQDNRCRLWTDAENLLF